LTGARDALTDLESIVKAGAGKRIHEKARLL